MDSHDHMRRVVKSQFKRYDEVMEHYSSGNGR